jgi:hypothetical protein
MSVFVLDPWILSLDTVWVDCVGLFWLLGHCLDWTVSLELELKGPNLGIPFSDLWRILIWIPLFDLSWTLVVAIATLS